MRKAYSITFLSDWHVGSGLGDAHIADAILTRDANGLPVLGGRAVKGALREGARRLGLCRTDLCDCVNEIFGTDSNKKSSNEPGRIIVSPAVLPDSLRSLFSGKGEREKRELVSYMTMLRSQTALEDGTAKTGSLRSMECGIACMSFHGNLELDVKALDVSEEWATRYLHALCAAVKSIGGYRSRGLGCCRMRLEGQPERVTVPQPLAHAAKGGAPC